MNRLLPCACIALLAACSSTPDRPIETAAAPQATRAAIQSQAVTPPAQDRSTADANSRAVQQRGVDPLDDPRSVLSKRSVYFDYDSTMVKAEYQPIARAHAAYLAQHPTSRVTIQGNTDERGSREYNLALGQRRADALKQQMTLSGARPGQIETVSFGEEKPRAEGETEQAWSENRRDDIVYAR